MMRKITIALGAALLLAGCAAGPAGKPQAGAQVSAAPAAVPELANASTAELEKRVAAGDTRANVELGSRYGLGKGVPVDYAKALTLLKAAAEKGDAQAQYFVGTAYYNGAGVPKDESIAVLWFEKSADQRFASAEYWLGFMIANGRGGIEQNWPAAIPYLQDAAQQGIAEAAFMVGYAYGDGEGIDHNPRAAAYWYRRALSIEPNGKAQYNLLRLIHDGQVTWQPGDPGNPPTSEGAAQKPNTSG
jgi:TPR repeat protein